MHAVLFRILITTFVLFVGISTSLAQQQAEGRVELEVVTASLADPAAAQQWLRVLQESGADGVRIRGPRTGDRAEIIRLGGAASRSYRIVGVVNDRGELELPGGKFRQRDLAGLGDYIERLKSQGIDGVTGERGAFGLTRQQYADLLEAVQRPIRESTKGRPPAEVVQKIAAEIGAPVRQGEAVELILAASDPAPVEVESLSSGTALAAVLNAYGLALEPRMTDQGELELSITADDPDREQWPVGHPIEKRPADLVPTLAKMLEVEIKGHALGDVIAAVQQQISVPFLFDHQSLGARGIDPAKVTIDYPAREAPYATILQGVLSRAMLKYEVRQDEAGAAFIWITTIR